MEKEFPRYLLANNERLMRTLLSMILESEACAFQGFRLLDCLPPNRDMREYVRLMAELSPGATSAQWHKFFESSEEAPATINLFYYITVADTIIKNSSNKEKNDFISRFVKNSGMVFLYKMFMTIDTGPAKRTAADKTAESKALVSIIRLLQSILENKPDKQLGKPEFINIINKTLVTMHLLLSRLPIAEPTREDNIEEANAISSGFSLILRCFLTMNNSEREKFDSSCLQALYEFGDMKDLLEKALLFSENKLLRKRAYVSICEQCVKLEEFKENFKTPARFYC